MLLGNKPLLNKANQVILDIAVFLFSIFASYFIRFEGFPRGYYLQQMLFVFPYWVMARLLSFYFFSVYSIAWRYISIRDAFHILKATSPISAILFMLRLFAPQEMEYLSIPFSIIMLEFLFSLFGSCGIRVTRRLSHEVVEKEANHKNNSVPAKVLLIGAGGAGNLVVKELNSRPDLGYDVVGFVDDDPRKFGTMLQGKRVLGSTSQISSLAKKLNPCIQ